MFNTPTNPKVAAQPAPGGQLPSQAHDEVAVLLALGAALVVAFPAAVVIAGVLLVINGRARYTAAALAAAGGGVWLLAVTPAAWGRNWLAVAKGVAHALSSHHRADWLGYVTAGAPAGMIAAAAAVVIVTLISGRSQPGLPRAAPKPSALRHRRALRRLTRHPVTHPHRSPLGIGPTGRISELSDEEANGHVLIVGATGSGKSVTLVRILTSVADRDIPCVLVDLKGSSRSAALLAAAAQRHNRPFYWVTLSGPTHYNPLRGDASEITSTIIGSETWSEPHYEAQASRQLQLILQALADPGARPDGGTWLSDVVDALSVDGLRRLAATVSSPTLAAALIGLAGSVRREPAALAGLAGRLGLLVESSAGRWLQRPPPGTEPFDLAAAIEENAVVVFTLDSSGHAKAAAQFGAMVIQDLKAIAGGRLERGVDDFVYVAVDEFSALAGPQLTGLLARGREAGFCVLLATQELADLTQVSPAFLDQVLGDTNVKIVHRQDVEHSAERLARTMGTDRAWDVSLSQTRAPGLFGAARTRNFTWFPADHNTVEPADLLRLPRGVALLMAKQPQLRVERIQVVPTPLTPAELPQREQAPR